MNRKISRNEKHKYSNEEKLALGENENTSALINIAQENDSNILKLLQKLWINNLWFIILKCSRFCLFVTFFILLLLHTQMFFTLQFSRLEKERKKQFKSQPLCYSKIFSFFQPPTILTSPTIGFWCFFQPPSYYSTPLSIRDLRVSCHGKVKYWFMVMLEFS